MTVKKDVKYYRKETVMANKFEASIKELEEIVLKLENGDISLEESLELFEKGVKISKTCQKLLDDAEKKVSVLIADGDGKMTKQDFPDME